MEEVRDVPRHFFSEVSYKLPEMVQAPEALPNDVTLRYLLIIDRWKDEHSYSLEFPEGFKHSMFPSEADPCCSVWRRRSV